MPRPAASPGITGRINMGSNVKPREDLTMENQIGSSVARREPVFGSRRLRTRCAAKVYASTYRYIVLEEYVPLRRPKKDRCGWWKAVASGYGCRGNGTLHFPKVRKINQFFGIPFGTRWGVVVPPPSLSENSPEPAGKSEVVEVNSSCETGSGLKPEEGLGKTTAPLAQDR